MTSLVTSLVNGLSPRPPVTPSPRLRVFAVLLFLIALGSQTSLLSQRSQPRIAYRISVNSADLSGFNVEMRIRGAGDRGAGEVVRLAMAAHPIYDDRYWRYVEQLTAESRGRPLQVIKDEDAVWSVRAPGVAGGTPAIQFGDVIVKYRIHLPQTTPNRSVWKPFLTPQADSLAMCIPLCTSSGQSLRRRA